MQDLNIEPDIFFVLTALLLAFGMYQTLGTALNTDTPVVSVISPSMEPTFYRGDLILVKGTSIDRLEAGRQDGDIIVFTSRYLRMPIIHRVINKHNHSVDTMGDANSRQVRYKLCDVGGRTQIVTPGTVCPGRHIRTVNVEENITEQQIKGEVFLIIPKLGYAKIIPTCLYMAVLYSPNHPAAQTICRGIL
ncbi:MAG: signal peptidase I [Candidatus Nanohaloarchaea archaeon]|nr:signal peptidase I [Candidatus Nanohaloarchaea archaeon]